MGYDSSCALLSAFRQLWLLPACSSASPATPAHAKLDSSLITQPHANQQVSASILNLQTGMVQVWVLVCGMGLVVDRSSFSGP